MKLAMEHTAAICATALELSADTDTYDHEPWKEASPHPGI